jgi:hypothetical protein
VKVVEQFAGVVGDIVGGDTGIVEEAGENDPAQQFNRLDDPGAIGQKGGVEMVGARLGEIAVNDFAGELVEQGYFIRRLRHVYMIAGCGF